jgi:hypothetical protein
MRARLRLCGIALGGAVVGSLLSNHLGMGGAATMQAFGARTTVVSLPRAAACALPQPPAFGEAGAALRDRRFSVAYGGFATLADEGHVESAQAALFMLRYGEAFFGTAWSASEQQQIFWQSLVIDAERRDIAIVADPGGE